MLQGKKPKIFVATFTDDTAAAQAAKYLSEKLGAKLTVSIRDGFEVWTIKGKSLDKLNSSASPAALFRPVPSGALT